MEIRAEGYLSKEKDISDELKKNQIVNGYYLLDVDYRGFSRDHACCTEGIRDVFADRCRKF